MTKKKIALIAGIEAGSTPMTTKKKTTKKTTKKKSADQTPNDFVCKIIDLAQTTYGDTVDRAYVAHLMIVAARTILRRRAFRQDALVATEFVNELAFWSCVGVACDTVDPPDPEDVAANTHRVRQFAWGIGKREPMEASLLLALAARELADDEGGTRAWDTTLKTVERATRSRSIPEPTKFPRKKKHK